MIQIQLGPMDRMFFDIVSELLDPEPDLAVIGRAETVAGAFADARRSAADVVLLQDGSGDEGVLGAALAPRPPAVLSIASSGRSGWIVRFQTRDLPIEAEQGGLAAAVRLAAAPGHDPVQRASSGA